MKAHWDLIPPETDILITHTPPKDVLDQSSKGRSLGREELAYRLAETKVQVHVFGHIHASYGKLEKHGRLYINGSSIQSGKGVRNKPIVFTLS